jgi:hypothetical protein
MAERKTVVIHQPDYMPYAGFFHRLLQCDEFLLLDHVQYSRHGWHNRDKIKTPEGVKWITVPVQLKGKGLQSINDVALNDALPWRAEHLQQLRRCYGEAPGFDEVYPRVEELYRYDGSSMVELNARILQWLMAALGLRVPVRLTSSLAPEGRANEMLVDLLRKVGATTYLSGVGARDYFDPAPFDAAGIEVVWQRFEHPVYPQRWGEFVPELSILDMLFNCGIAGARAILETCG